MKQKKILIINYFLFIGGGEKLLMELVEFCLKNNVQPDVLIPDNKEFGDNQSEEHYDKMLRDRGVKVYRVPVFFKKYNASFLHFCYWRLKLRYSDVFYHSVHIINLNLSDRLYSIVKNKNRYFWHIVNKMQFTNRRYPYSSRLLSKPNDNVVLINKYQSQELKEHFKTISSNIIHFKLFLN